MQTVYEALQVIQRLWMPSDEFRQARAVVLVRTGLAPYQIDGPDFGMRKRCDRIAGLPALKLQRCLAPLALIAAEDRSEWAFFYLISTVLWPLRAALIRSCEVWLLVSGCSLPSGGSKR